MAEEEGGEGERRGEWWQAWGKGHLPLMEGRRVGCLASVWWHPKTALGVNKTVAIKAIKAS